MGFRDGGGSGHISGLCAGMGHWRRFPRVKQVGGYLGLIPAEAFSASASRRNRHDHQVTLCAVFNCRGCCLSYTRHKLFYAIAALARTTRSDEWKLSLHRVAAAPTET
ncbi:MAG: transposase [Acidobacteriota bacterium]